MTKSQMRKSKSPKAKVVGSFNNGSVGKLGNSRKPVTAVQKHKGKGY